MQIQLIQSETVKPSSITPENFRRYEFSFLDQIAPSDMVPLLLLYSGTTNHTSVSETSQLLVKSLSQALTRFYPFAGRLRNNIFIECNDDGAEFEATKVNCPLSTILLNPVFDTLVELAPRQKIPKDDLFRSPLLLVKANFFNCGGLAIGVCFSHKIADASTMSMFLNCWASYTSKLELEPTLIPQFLSRASIFPPMSVSLTDPYKESQANEKIELKRLVFDGPRVEVLRSKVASNSTVLYPTRVEAVSALIWKCVIKASSLSNHSKPDKRRCAFIQAVNLRKRMNPCLPENSVGNLVWSFQAKIPSSIAEETFELKDLVALLRKGIEEFKVIWKKRNPSEALSGFMEEMLRPKDDDVVRQFVSTSWCKFPLYGADFGWGKPEWICSPLKVTAKNACVMMDARDGRGIEVALWLDEEEMKHFETNPELLAFASLNPEVII